MAEVNVPNIVRGVVPYDDAHACSDLLFGVLALLHAVGDTIEEDGPSRDFHGLTSPNSRAQNLLTQAMRHTSEAIKALNV